MVGGSTSNVSTANTTFHINSDYVGGAAYMHIHQLNILHHLLTTLHQWVQPFDFMILQAEINHHILQDVIVVHFCDTCTGAIYFNRVRMDIFGHKEP